MAQVKVKSEIAAMVWKIEAAVGAKVGEGDEILILKSMKMEIPIVAPSAGTIVQLLVKETDTVAEGQVLAMIET